ncbi:MAG: hypothetical protein LBG65_06520 [Puniceicoccales bacterium]|jgi:D-ribose pyranose/furanose isomerase RbsD|nr:hypothetical protein [Puniceicoccales bacterium]
MPQDIPTNLHKRNITTTMASKNPAWKDELKAALPLLGHRNWIVVADMAYPLQAQPGIRTLFVDDDYVGILKHVHAEISKAAHIKAGVYLDAELDYLDEKLVPGIENLRRQMKDVFGPSAQSILHEEMIQRLDAASRTFNVLLLKSNLTIPYTTTFFELDCAYWDSEREKTLRKKLSAKK